MSQRERGGGMSDEETLETYLKDIRTAVPPGRDATARAVRRQRIVHTLRQRVVTLSARRRRFQFWRRVSLGALVLGTATSALIAVTHRLDSRRPELAQRTSVNDGVGIGVVKGTLKLSRQTQVPGQSQTEMIDRGLAAGEDIVVGLGDSLETTGKGGAQLMLSDVASLTLGADTRVAQISAPAGHVERITLSKGQAHLWVSKLREGRRFHVITPDADVQVRGTEFDVELLPGPKPRTCVRVQEGLVLVTSGAARELLEAGRTWGCDGAAGASPATDPQTTTALPLSRGASKKIVLTASDLRIQNALFQRGLRAQRDGRYAAAAEVYQQLLDRYPDGPLSAQAEENLAAMPAPR